MGGSSSQTQTSTGGDKVSTARYAPYVEAQHSNFLDITESHTNAVIPASPFVGYERVPADTAFFGFGLTLGSLPGMYSVFSEHLLNLDLGIIWNDSFTKEMTRPEVVAKLKAEVVLKDDSLTKDTLAGFQVSMRNLNAVCSSSFVMGKAILETDRVKAISALSISSKLECLPEVLSTFNKTLNWHKQLVAKYLEIMKAYFLWKWQADEDYYINRSKDVLWPFSVLSFEGSALATLQGTRSWNKAQAEVPGRSTISKVLLVGSYAVTGFYVGSAVPVVGSVIGAVVGTVVGVAMVLFE